MMKSYSKFLLIILIAIFKVSISVELTPAENLERLKNCGPKREDAFKTNWTSEDYFVRVRSENSKVQLNTSVGTFISPRHIITSAQSVISYDYHWADGQIFPKRSWCDEKDPVQDAWVPHAVREKIKVSLGPCPSKTACPTELQVKQATILGICADEPEFSNMFRVMIIEVKDYKHEKYACSFGGIDDNLKEPRVVTISNNYAFWNGVKLDENFDPNEKIITASRKFTLETSRGAAMIVVVNDRHLMIGILGYMKKEHASINSYFFNVKQYRKEICSLSGICHLDLPTTTKRTTMIRATSKSKKELSTTTLEDSTTRTTSESEFSTSSESPTIIVPLNSDGSSTTTLEMFSRSRTIFTSSKSNFTTPSIPMSSSETTATMISESSSTATSISSKSSEPPSSSRKLETCSAQAQNILDEFELLDDGEEHEEIQNSTGKKEIFGFGLKLWIYYYHLFFGFLIPWNF